MANSTYQDVVGVFDTSGTQQFTQARSMRLQVTRDSKAMQHPIEDGASVVDHRVILPMEAQLMVVLQAKDYRDMYSQIQGLFASGQILSLQCKATTFNNMYIASIPHEESPDMLDAVQIVLKLVEAQFFKTQATASTPRASKSATTIKRGEQSASEPRSSTLYRLTH